MKKQELIKNLENIIEKIKSLGNDDIVIWAYDHYGYPEDGDWIVMDGKFELDEKNCLNII